MIQVISLHHTLSWSFHVLYLSKHIPRMKNSQLSQKALENEFGLTVNLIEVSSCAWNKLSDGSPAVQAMARKVLENLVAMLSRCFHTEYQLKQTTVPTTAPKQSGFTWLQKKKSTQCARNSQHSGFRCPVDVGVAQLDGLIQLKSAKQSYAAAVQIASCRLSHRHHCPKIWHHCPKIELLMLPSNLGFRSALVPVFLFRRPNVWPLHSVRVGVLCHGNKQSGTIFWQPLAKLPFLNLALPLRNQGGQEVTVQHLTNSGNTSQESKEA